ncbi:MAG: hypothetical protein LBV79_01025, partial [Candidatus Adiutrix sp.]|nr:hypothetical protein [Candidatus Adiutrix sp.]
MRCPKCGYNSFDHSLKCPKCRKDLVAIRRILNLTIPSPGQVNFFQISSQRAVFAEPVLGGGMAPAPAPAFGAPPAFGAAPAAPAATVDLFPAVDDDDDIAPVGFPARAAVDDDDDIAPANFSVPAAPAAPAPRLDDFMSPPPAAPARTQAPPVQAAPVQAPAPARTQAPPVQAPVAPARTQAPPVRPTPPPAATMTPVAL